MPREREVGDEGLVGTFVDTGPGARAAPAAPSFHLRRDYACQLFHEAERRVWFNCILVVGSKASQEAKKGGKGGGFYFPVTAVQVRFQTSKLLLSLCYLFAVASRQGFHEASCGGHILT